MLDKSDKKCFKGIQFVTSSPQLLKEDRVQYFWFHFRLGEGRCERCGARNELDPAHNRGGNGSHATTRVSMSVTLESWWQWPVKCKHIRVGIFQAPSWSPNLARSWCFPSSCFSPLFPTHQHLRMTLWQAVGQFFSPGIVRRGWDTSLDFSH